VPEFRVSSSDSVGYEINSCDITQYDRVPQSGRFQNPAAFANRSFLRHLSEPEVTEAVGSAGVVDVKSIDFPLGITAELHGRQG
jgi:hypothetical protein